MNRKLFDAQLAQFSLEETSGEHSVDFSSDLNCYIPKMQISGGTSQPSYKGHNLLNKEDFLIEALRNETRYTGYGSICLNTEQLQSLLKPSTTYVISFDYERYGEWPDGATLSSSGGFHLWNADLTKSIFLRGGSYPAKGVIGHQDTSFTTPADLTGWHLRSYEYMYKLEENYKTTACILRNVQITEGSTIKTFEPYTGKKSSPNPEMPQEITHMGAYNLFDDTLITVGKQISEDGTEGNNTHQRLSNYIEVEPNTPYRLSDIYNTFTVWDANSAQPQFDRCACYDADKNLISVAFSASRTQRGQHTQVFYTAKDTKYIRITQGKFAEKTMLTKGLDFVPYTPFNSQGEIICQSSNLIKDVSDIFWHSSTYTNRYKEVEKDGRRCIYYIFNTNRKYVIEGGFKPNTAYTFSLDYVTGADLYGSATKTQIITVFYTNGTRGTFSSDSKVWAHKTFTSDANRTIDYIGTYTNLNVEIWIDRDTFTIQEGAITNPVYEPYWKEELTIPTEVNVNDTVLPLQMSQFDRLSVDTRNNKVTYIEGNWKKEITGSEKWYKANADSSYGNWFVMYTSNYDGILAQSAGYSNYFKRGTYLDSSANNSFIPVYNGGISYVTVRDDTYTTAEEFTTWLQEKYAEGKPLVFYLKKRAGFVDYDITNTEFGQQLLSLIIKRGSNRLSVSSAPKSSLSITYPKHK